MYKKILVVIGCLSIVTALAGSALAVTTYQSINKAGCTSGAGYNAVKKGIAALDAHDTAQLDAARSTIESLHTYKSDPSCMYIVTLAYTESGKPDEAKKALALLESAYNKANSFGDAVGNSLYTLDQIKSRITFAEQLNTSLQNSVKVNNIKRSE